MVDDDFAEPIACSSLLDPSCSDTEAKMTATGVVETPDKRQANGGCRGRREATAAVEIDVVSKCIGEFGRWQLLITFLLSLLNIPCTFHIFAMTFEAGQSDFWCAPPARFSNMSATEWIAISHVKDSNCMIKDLDYEHSSIDDLMRQSEEVVATKRCEKWNYDMSQFGETVITEWDLVCEKHQWVSFAEMIFLAGVAVGGLASGFISDRFGRKMTLMCSLVAQIALGIGVAVSPCYWVFTVLRFFLGFVSVSIVLCGFVLCIELVGGKWVTISGVSYLFTIPLGYIGIAGMAYYIQNWRKLQMAISLPAIIFPLLSWLFMESPRWLITMKDADKAQQVMEHIAKFNKKELPPHTDKLIKKATLDNGDTDAPSVGIVDLFNTPEIRKVSFVMYSIWFSVYFVYYGLTLNVGNWGGNIYLASLISAAVEAPSIALSILILLKMGRRVPLCIATVLGGIFCVIAAFVAEDEKGWTMTILATAAKFCIASSNVVMPIFTAEKFPTAMRNLGVGSSNAPAGIALLIVPYIWDFSAHLHIQPMAVLGVCGILGGLSVLILPESSHL